MKPHHVIVYIMDLYDKCVVKYGADEYLCREIYRVLEQIKFLVFEEVK